MNLINGAQIRAARGLLNLTQDNLADICRLSPKTIRLIENDCPVRLGNIRKIQETLKDHGVEFLNDYGVKLQAKDIRVINGTNSCDELFAYIFEILKHRGNGLTCIIPDQIMLTTESGRSERTNIERLEEIRQLVPVKCLLADSDKAIFRKPKFDVRAFLEDPYMMPAAIFSFGRKRVLGFFQRDTTNITFVVADECNPEQAEHGFFFHRWNIAKPVQFAEKPKR